MTIQAPHERMFPLESAAHVRMALTRVNQFHFGSELVRLVAYHRIRLAAEAYGVETSVDIDSARLHALADGVLLQVWHQATDGRHGVPATLVQLISEELDTRPHLLGARDAVLEDGNAKRGLPR